MTFQQRPDPFTHRPMVVSQQDRIPPAATPLIVRDVIDTTIHPVSPLRSGANLIPQTFSSCRSIAYLAIVESPRSTDHRARFGAADTAWNVESRDPQRLCQHRNRVIIGEETTTLEATSTNAPEHLRCTATRHSAKTEFFSPGITAIVGPGGSAKATSLMPSAGFWGANYTILRGHRGYDLRAVRAVPLEWR
jgi:hypothetical protein